MRIMLFTALLIGCCGYALWRGGAPERIVGAALAAAYVATVLTYSSLPQRFVAVEIGTLAVDLTLLVVLVAVAVCADRFWPFIVGGLHLSSVGAHLLKYLDVNMIRVTYALMIAMWSYPMLIALAIGTRRHQLRLKRQGYDLAWTVRDGHEHGQAGPA